MKNLASLIAITIFFVGCADRPSQEDLKFVENLNSQIQIGMTIHQLNLLHAKHSETIEIWNICLEKHEKRPTKCGKGYSAKTTFTLPTETLFSEKGDAQFYFEFNSDGNLTSWWHELYYPEQHV